MDSTVAQITFVEYEKSVREALDAVDAESILPGNRTIVIKPNLTNSNQPPVTTDVRMVEAIYKYCSERTETEIVVGEGCGDGQTSETFDANGYAEFSKKYGVRLIDFNEEKAVKLSNKSALQLKSFYVPEILVDAFVISAPVLKDHSFTATTIAMKNMFGIAPAPYYRGSWNKSKLHSPSTHKSVYDICLYKKPDLSVVDASVALSGMHLAGTRKKIGLILAATDPVAVDSVGSGLLGHDPEQIEYLTLSNGRHGNIMPV